MAQISLVSVNLASIFLQSLLYGVFLVFFGASTYLMVQRHRRLSTGRSSASTLARNPLFIAGILLFILITVHWSLVIYGAFIAFVYSDGGRDPAAFYSNFGSPDQSGRTTVFSIVLFIADIVQLHRVWVIWQGNKYVMIVPTLSFLTALSTGIAAVHLEDSGKWALSSEVTGFVTASTISTLVTNVTSCVLIVWKLWSINRVSESHFGSTTSNSKSTSSVRSLRWTMSVLIESAALYAGWGIFYVILHELRTNLEFPISDAWLPVTGIAFMLINVRVGLGYTLQRTQDTPATLPRWHAPTRSSAAQDPTSIAFAHSGLATGMYTTQTDTGFGVSDTEVANSPSSEDEKEKVVLEVSVNSRSRSGSETV